MNNCLCEFLSSVWCQMLKGTAYRSGISREASMEAVLDNLTSKQVSLELQDRRCVAEARRHNASGSKALFRAKMLEHRRVQAQLLQIQGYREKMMAQIDALSNHEINQTFLDAIKGMTGAQKGISSKEVVSMMEEYHESVGGVKEMSELLGQPLMGEEISDEDLEQEFLEASAEPVRIEIAAAPAKISPQQIRAQPELIIPLVAALN
jgi:hypothetical protein